MERFFTVLVTLSIGGSLMALLLLGLKALLKGRLSSTVYYYLWLLVLFRFMLPLPGLIGESRAVATAAEYTQAFSYRELGELSSPVFTQTEPQPAEPAVPTLSPAKAPALPVKPTPRQLMTLALAVYAAGVLIRFTVYYVSYRRFARSLKLSLAPPDAMEKQVYEAENISKKPELMRSTCVKTPMLLGLLHPLLVLPERDYSPDMLQNIFRHELMHYRRGDMLYKWFAVLVFSLQWFNPLCILMRREINRACELSCDEQLILNMDAQQKQSYGDTLISMATVSTLTDRIVATTFVTEKRNLKERLEQIMKFRKKKSAAVAALLAVLLLAGSGAVLGPKADAAPAPSAETAPVLEAEPPARLADDKPIVVSNVDEFLSALGSDRTINLKPGDYRLSEARGYGVGNGENYSWEEVYDGYELVIHNVENLSINGMDDDRVSITALPRYANVLRFSDCNNVMINDLILGHDEEPGACSGGVVYMQNSQYMHLDDCSLYGCGIIGLYTDNCRKVFLSDCEIYDCSIGAVQSYASYDVRVNDCDIYRVEAPYFSGLFDASNCTGFAVTNCDIYSNSGSALMSTNHSQQVYFMGNDVENCQFDALFSSMAYPVTVEGCEFENVRYTDYCSGMEGFDIVPPVDANGSEIDEQSLMRMEQRDAHYEGPKMAENVELAREVDAHGRSTVTVKTVDEFLAAIGPDTTIKLDVELFDLSTAADYGAYGTQYYYWVDNYDGPELVISGVEGLRIEGVEGKGAVIAAQPRYADVLSFVNCEDIELVGFTAGHTEEPGSCTGGVLYFENCENVRIDNCWLYGCGILGITAQYCEDFLVEDSKLTDCSNGAVWLGTCEDFRFVNCLIHDCGTPEFSLQDVREIYFDDLLLKNGMYTMGENGPESFSFED